MYGKIWTEKECDYLQEKWGTVSLKGIAKNLNRSENSILLKVQHLGLSPFLESGDYITWHQLLVALGIDSSGMYKNISWIKNRGCPVKMKKVNKCSFKIIYLDDFWKWAEKNIDFLDFSGFEEKSLGVEPGWVKEKRRRDIASNQNYIKSPWTRTEDERLKKLLRDYKYSYSDISKMLRRTNGAIQRRRCDLKIMERPIKADNHIKWTDKQYGALLDLISKGYGYEYMAEVIGKSSKAIRGKVYSCYGTENLDKARLKLA